MNANRRRVLVIDNNLMMAQAVVLALTQLDFSARFMGLVVATQPNSLGTWQPNVALLDIDSTTMAAAVGCIRAMRDVGIPIAVVTSNFETLIAGESIRAGAVSVVHKAAPLSQLVNVISNILDGGEVLESYLRQRLLERGSHLAPFDILTHREKFVLSQLMEGRAADAIAEGSCVSISTVRSQIKAILQKLGVNSQLAAACLARQVGWTYTPAQDAGIGAVVPCAHATSCTAAAADGHVGSSLSGPPGNDARALGPGRHEPALLAVEVIAPALSCPTTDGGAGELLGNG
jgi:two-component system, NarL family, nitrate/nitrite response regulator NarL